MPSLTPSPQPPQRTGGPRSAGRIARSERDATGRTDRGRGVQRGMRDGPAVCRTGLSFSGRHSSVGRTPYGGAPLKSLVSNHEPSALHRALPPAAVPHRRSAIRWPDRPDRTERRDAGCHTRCVMGPLYAEHTIGLFRRAQVNGSHTTWGSNPEKPRQRAQHPPSSRPSPNRCTRAPPVLDPLAGSNGATDREPAETRGA